MSRTVYRVEEAARRLDGLVARVRDGASITLVGPHGLKVMLVPFKERRRPVSDAIESNTSEKTKRKS
jgi:antitoxin (DNA-binding transcriptional repressor) of toxin-antitoxin stability system